MGREDVSKWKRKRKCKCGECVQVEMFCIEGRNVLVGKVCREGVCGWGG